MNKQPLTRSKTTISPFNQLTHHLSSFVGRKKELAQAHQYLAQTRILTLIGVGGCGKTRLAQQMAAQALSTHSYEDGVWFVELAVWSDPGLVPQAVAQTLGIRELFDQTAMESLLDFLRERSCLLVLDNCEHVLAACAQLAETLLLASPQLKILATSREPLRLGGETIFLVPSLSLPESNQSLLLSDLMHYDAPALFLERAKSVLPSFTPTEENLPAMLQVCRRLDGIPLAIELAAARANVLTVQQIAARLDDRFNLLTANNPSTVLPRHQTLRATIDWSYDLLSEKERLLFRRLAVFAGSFTLDAAEGICAAQDFEQREILGELARLVSKSLILAETLEQPEARYDFLETIREYARNLLRESGEENVLRQRHQDWYLRLAENAEAQWRGPRQKEVFQSLEGDHENLRAALEWSKSTTDSVEAGLRLGGALWRFWEINDHFHEGFQHLTHLLVLPQAQAKTVARAKALYGAGYLAMKQGLEQDYTVSEALMEESLAVARELKDPQWIANGIYGLGVVARFRGDYARAEELLYEALRLFRQLEDRVGIYTSLYNLAEAATARGAYERAHSLHEESLQLKQLQKDEWSIANSMLSLATVARLRENYEDAIDKLEQSLERFQKIGDTANLALCLREFSAIAAVRGHSQVAVRLYAAADTVLETLGYLSDHTYRAVSNHPLAAVHARMGAARFQKAWEHGHSMTLDQVMELAHDLRSALRHKLEPQVPIDQTVDRKDLIVPLNDRELEILHLIAEGLSNHEIAERLVIAVSTVKWHINNVFGKLAVRSRTQAVAQARELGLL